MLRIANPSTLPVTAPSDRDEQTAAREDVLGFPVCTQSADALVDEIDEALRSRRGARSISFLNPHSAVVARTDPRFLESLHGSDWIVADGAGIVLASRFGSGRIRQRITGADVFHGLNARLDARGGSVFFLGSTPDNLAEIERRMARDYPSLRVAGVMSPPFKPEYTPEESAQMIAAINAARPDVLWVGMTAPKQEKWIHAHLSRLDIGLAAGIGAVFDFYTDRVQRSHPLFQRLGLEWLPRLLREPTRLWRRTFVSAPVFLGCVLSERLHRMARRS